MTDPTRSWFPGVCTNLKHTSNLTPHDSTLLRFQQKFPPHTRIFTFGHLCRFSIGLHRTLQASGITRPWYTLHSLLHEIVNNHALWTVSSGRGPWHCYIVRSDCGLMSLVFAHAICDTSGFCLGSDCGRSLLVFHWLYLTLLNALGSAHGHNQT